MTSFPDRVDFATMALVISLEILKETKLKFDREGTPEEYVADTTNEYLKIYRAVTQNKLIEKKPA